MNRGPRLAAVVVLVLAGTQGHAQTIFFDGNKLVEEMRQLEQVETNAADADTLKAGMHVGYVLGVAEAQSGVSWCPREGWSLCKW